MVLMRPILLILLSAWTCLAQFDFRDVAFLVTANQMGGNTSSAPSTLITNLVSFWPLDEAGGTRYDLVGTNHFTAYNTPNQVTGLFTNAIDFDAADTDQLAAADADSLSDTNFSVSAWIQFNSVSSAARFVSKYATAGREWYSTVLTNSGKVKISVAVYEAGSTVNTVNTINTTLNAEDGSAIGSWFHYVISFNRTSSTMSQWFRGTNGVWAYTNAANSRSMLNGNQALKVAANNSYGTENFDGVIDDLCYWNRALSSNEVFNIWSAGTNRVSWPWNGY
jgi:hypothetical protein